MPPDVYIVGQVCFFLGALIGLGIVSRLFAFILSQFKVSPKKRYVISDLLALCIAVTNSLFFTQKFSLMYVVGALLWLAFDLQRIDPWIYKVLKLSPSTVNPRFKLGKHWHVIKQLKVFDFIRIAVSATLLVSLFSFEYNSDYAHFFNGICFATFGACAYAAYLAIRQKKYGWAWTLAIIAMTYNPFRNIYDKGNDPFIMFQIKYKIVVNIIASVVLLLSIHAFRSQTAATEKICDQQSREDKCDE